MMESPVISQFISLVLYKYGTPQKAFEAFAVNDDGVILSRSSFKRLVQAIGLDISETDRRQLRRKFDPKGTRRIPLEDFAQVMANPKPPSKELGSPSTPRPVSRARKVSKRRQSHIREVVKPPKPPPPIKNSPAPKLIASSSAPKQTSSSAPKQASSPAPKQASSPAPKQASSSAPKQANNPAQQQVHGSQRPTLKHVSSPQHQGQVENAQNSANHNHNALQRAQNGTVMTASANPASAKPASAKPARANGERTPTSSRKKKKAKKPRQPDISGQVVEGRFRIDRRVGEGAFGATYKGVDLSDDSEVCLKVEHPSARHSRIQNEYDFYRSLSPGKGIPSVRWIGSHGKLMVMVMELLGMDLEAFRCQFPEAKVPVSICCDIAVQVLKRLEHCHDRGIVHRDIKPENIMLGRGSCHRRCYMVDFGISKRFLNPDTGEHSPMVTGKKFAGTPRYCSVHTHRGVEQGRRDDVESVGYSILYLARGSLPWQGIGGVDKAEKHAKVKALKEGTPLVELCWVVRGLPPAFQALIETARDMDFVGRPDYSALRKIFRSSKPCSKPQGASNKQGSNNNSNSNHSKTTDANMYSKQSSGHGRKQVTHKGLGEEPAVLPVKDASASVSAQDPSRSAGKQQCS